MYVISVEEVAWGIVLIAATMAMHAFAMPATLQASNALQRIAAERTRESIDTANGAASPAAPRNNRT